MNLYAYVGGNPVMFVDPEGLLYRWAGPTAVGAVGRGINTGGGWGWDTELGKGEYLTVGPTAGLAGSAGGEVGIYSGSVKDVTNVFTIGAFGFSLGLVVGEDFSGVGVVAGYGKGLPFEASYSRNQTFFDPDKPPKPF